MLKLIIEEFKKRLYERIPDSIIECYSKYHFGDYYIHIRINVFNYGYHNTYETMLVIDTRLILCDEYVECYIEKIVNDCSKIREKALQDFNKYEEKYK